MSTLAAPRPGPAVREAAAGGALLPLWFARGGDAARVRRVRRAALGGAARAGRARARVGGGRRGRARGDRAARAPRAWRPLARWVAATAVALARDRARAARRRRSRTSTCGPTTGASCSPASAAASTRCPGVRVPYRGLDEWTRLVIGVGGTLLVGRRRAARVLAAARPHRLPGGGADRARDALRRARRGAQLRRRVPPRRGAGAADARVPAAREAARARRHRPPASSPLVAAIGALIAAPALDGREPWFDYESWAVETAGTEVGHVQLGPRLQPARLAARRARDAARQGARAGLLEGARPRPVRRPRLAPGSAPARRGPGGAAARRARPTSTSWRQRIEVTIRNLRSDTFVTAGITTAVDGEDGYPIGGGVFNAPDGLKPRRLLLGRRLHARARPSGSCAQTPRRDYQDWLRSYRRDLHAPSRATAVGDAGRGRAACRSGSCGRSGATPACRRPSASATSRDPPSELLGGQRHGARVGARAAAQARGRPTPFEYVAARRGATSPTASPTPRRRRRRAETLDGFLFDAKIGFCQQFSGAEALLLRMGGDARRASRPGFTSGSFDERQQEFVVRDLDAHSWVEAWFPGYGWVTRDPTPAAAPPRSQPGERRGRRHVRAAPGRAEPRRRAPERPRERPRARAGRRHELGRARASWSACSRWPRWSRGAAARAPPPPAPAAARAAADGRVRARAAPRALRRRRRA